MIRTHSHLAVAAAAPRRARRDDEGSRVCGPGWRARRGAESRECRGEATHDGGQDVSHDVTGKGNQKQSRAGAGRLPCNGILFLHASDAAQDPNSAPHGRCYKSCAGGRIVQCPRLRVLPKAH